MIKKTLPLGITSLINGISLMPKLNERTGNVSIVANLQKVRVYTAEGDFHVATDGETTIRNLGLVNNMTAIEVCVFEKASLPEAFKAVA